MHLLEPRDEAAIKEYLDALASGEGAGNATVACQVDGCQMQAREGDEGYCQTHLRQVRMFGQIPPVAN